MFLCVENRVYRSGAWYTFGWMKRAIIISILTVPATTTSNQRIQQFETPRL